MSRSGYAALLINRSGCRGPFARRLQRHADRIGLPFYAFAPGDVDAARRLILGTRYDWRSGRWRRALYPFPAAVYDRYVGGLRGRYTCPALRRDRRILFFSPPLPGKWETYTALRQEAALVPHLPVTRVLSGDALEEMLALYRSVYVKPTYGGQGRRVLRIAREESGAFLCVGRVRSGRIRGWRIGRLRVLRRFVRRWTGRTPFIIQQGLDLPRLGRAPFDFRVLIQKDGRGEWRVTGIGARVGRPRSPISNLAGGGKALPASIVLHRLFTPEEAARIGSGLVDLAFATAAGMERHFGPFGEFGLDIAVDRLGRLWLLECNVKPARTLFRQLGDRRRDELTVRRPVQYLRHLARLARQRVGDDHADDGLLPVAAPYETAAVARSGVPAGFTAGRERGESGAAPTR